MRRGVGGSCSAAPMMLWHPGGCTQVATRLLHTSSTFSSVATQLLHASSSFATWLPHPSASSFASYAALESSCAPASTDLSTPASWYPTARALQRRIVAHVGPTNSGKTHQALAALKQAGTGVYCGPLRLLAWEVAERLNGSGVACNLVTGQEKKEVSGARHVACTVEMASTSRVVDVAVVDEIQMMADASRGWAFTRALLGLPARTLHVCGDPAALPLLEGLCEEAGDELEVRWYERLSPLRASRRPLGDLGRVQRGDCVVAFSRREVHALRREIEAAGSHKCCVVYGALPPEARSRQASLFNRPRTGYNVLAASDAVGMGLNLNIRRIIFHSLAKFDGVEQRPLTVAETKQIAGRAGRYGGCFPEGVVTTLAAEDLPALHAALSKDSEPLGAACIFPRYEHLSLFASQHPQAKLASVLERFADHAVLGERYFFAQHDDMRTLAVMLKHLPISLREAYLFCLAPCDPEDTPVATMLLTLATAYARRQLVTPALIAHPPLAIARSEQELQQLEAAHRMYDLYCWLSYRFEDAFAGRAQAEAARAVCAALVDESIREMGWLGRGRNGRCVDEAATEAQAAAALLSAAQSHRAQVPQQLWQVWGAEQKARKRGAQEWSSGVGDRGRSSGASSGTEGDDEEWKVQQWRERKRAYAKRR